MQSTANRPDIDPPGEVGSRCHYKCRKTWSWSDNKSRELQTSEFPVARWLEAELSFCGTSYTAALYTDLRWRETYSVGHSLDRIIIRSSGIIKVIHTCPWTWMRGSTMKLRTISLQRFHWRHNSRSPPTDELPCGICLGIAGLGRRLPVDTHP